MKSDLPIVWGFTNPKKLKPMPGTEFPEPDWKVVEQLLVHHECPPVVCTSDLFVLAGADRAAAARHVKWDKVHSVVYPQKLSQLTEAEIETIQNAARKHLDENPVWLDRLAA